MSRPRALLLCALLALVTVARAADIPLSFDSAATQARYDTLLAELRCLVCQNQSLADSHAELAQDLRNEVYRMLQQGDSDQAIVDYLVARYGDFVLYRPPLRSSTWLLWIGPFVLACIGMVVVVISARRRRATVPALAPEDRARLAALLDPDRHGQA